MEPISINNYIFEKPLTSENSGFSKWGFGYRGGQVFFVKEFLSPAYPAEDAVYSEKQKQERLRLCDAFVQEKIALYEAIRAASDGNLVAVEQFFRVGAKYYISTEAITEPLMTIGEIVHRPFPDRLRLCCSIAHAMQGLHAQHIIHADIKPDNILVTDRGVPCAKIIDFDCSFFEENSPALGEELNGDMVYLSPEGFLHIAGVESNLSCKMDIFALGIVFHQYFTGRLPGFDTKEYQYAYESVLDDHPLDVSDIGNEQCRWLVWQMLAREPAERPDIDTVFQMLNELLLDMLDRSPAEPAAPPEPDPFFFQPGDL